MKKTINDCLKESQRAFNKMKALSGISHTPLPWSIDKTDQLTMIVDSKKDVVAALSTIDLKGRPEEEMANAAFIVKAVNSHDALVEALRQARIALTPHVFIDDDARQARNKADEALKLAEAL